MSKKSLSYFHSYPIQIRFNDIDQLGHVTNSVYQQYFDLGKMTYFEQVLGERMDFQTEGLIVVTLTINFLSSVKLYDEVEVRTKVTRLGNKSLDIEQEIFDKTSGETVAECKSVMVGFKGSTEESILIPDRWRGRIVEFETDVLFEV